MKNNDRSDSESNDSFMNEIKPNVFGTFGLRITQIHKEISISKEEFSESLEVSKRTLQRYENDERTPDLCFLKLLCFKHDINPMWVLFGKGEMIEKAHCSQLSNEAQLKKASSLPTERNRNKQEVKSTNNESIMDTTDNISWLKSTVNEMGVTPSDTIYKVFETLLTMPGNSFSVVPNQSNQHKTIVKAAIQELFNEKSQQSFWIGDPAFDLIPEYRNETLAQRTGLLGDQPLVSPIAFHKKWIKEMQLDDKSLVSLKAQGDSMMPTINCNDIILIDTRSNKFYGDGIYAVIINEQLSVKRIQRNIDRSLTLISDNKAYNEMLLTERRSKDIEIIGRAVWHGHAI